MTIIIYNIDIFRRSITKMATLPDPNNERFVSESIAAYNPVPGVIVVDGKPNALVIPFIDKVLAPDTSILVASKPATAAIAFADIVRP